MNTSACPALRVWWLGALLLGVSVVAACDEPVDTPEARIHLFTRCEVPSGAIQAHDRVEGAEHAEAWARVLLPREKVDAFVRSCGFEPPLDEDYDDPVFAPRADPWWWDAHPGEVLSSGAVRREGAFESQLLIVPRDTDTAVYVHTRSN